MTIQQLAAAAVVLIMPSMGLAQEPSSTTQSATHQDTTSVPQDTTSVPAVGEPSSAVAAPAATVAPEPAVIDSAKDYRIGPEDVLDILVWKQDNLSRTVPVRPDGKVSLPLVNDVQAAGLTPGELRRLLTDRLADYVSSPEVSVIVKEVHSVKVSVLGAVRMPGHYEVKSPATVLDLIARAQGLTDFADRGRIVVLRQHAGSSSTTRIPFNYRKVADGTEQDNFFVQPGDIIVVP